MYTHRNRRRPKTNRAITYRHLSRLSQNALVIALLILPAGACATMDEATREQGQVKPVLPGVAKPALLDIKETSYTSATPEILTAAATYVTAFRDKLAGMVSEEHYKQHVRTPAIPTGRSIFGGANTNPLFDEEHVELQMEPTVLSNTVMYLK